ncbi:MAG: PKD domain-containing protein, partial [Nitrospirota bacterium]
WSPEVSQGLTVEQPSVEVIVDNGAAGTSFTGSWAVSGAPNPYGANSLYGRDGALYKWRAALPRSGQYQVYMWWTEWPSRAADVPVTIQYRDGSQTVRVNQQLDGGKWNYLGAFMFDNASGGTVSILAERPSPTTYSADAVKFVYVPDQPPVTEDIYVALGYNFKNMKPPYEEMLQGMGATYANGVWTYHNRALNESFRVRFIEDMEAFKQALRTEGAHIIYSGHSNYGLGAVFGTLTETASQTIENIRYIDDARILNTSSPVFPVSMKSLRTTQAFPYWWPLFQDGTSGIMPYTFGDPRGAPPYNYYITYQVPGDPTFYKVDSARRNPIIRYFDSSTPAWYSSTGTPPDPANTDHQKYFIVNTAPWYPSFESSGEWYETQIVKEYFSENYMYAPLGGVTSEAKWLFKPLLSGTYTVYALWPSSTSRSASAPYTIGHAGGSTTVAADQRYNGGKWNSLGQFSFNAANYSVRLTGSSSGTVAADAIKIAHVSNPPMVLQANFYTRTRAGTEPLEVDFYSRSTGDIRAMKWDFGDGSTSTRMDEVTRIYSKPGTYTVTLTVYGPLGSSTKTKTGYITVGSTTAPLRAEFSARVREGVAPLAISFVDASTGSIKSWFWEFGDGTTSTAANPSHTYSKPGNYTVKMTVTDTNGAKSTEVKENFIRAVVFEKNIDNVDYPKTHYGTKTVISRKEMDIQKEELRYGRMFYEACYSGIYYLDIFNRGTMFYSVDLTTELGGVLYLKSYMEGKSDNEIWQVIQNYEPVYDYYYFNKKPSEQ